MDYLAHHGIKGMKWGVRRTDAQLGHPSSSQSPRMATTSDLLGNALKGMSTPTFNASQMRAADKQAEAFVALGNAALSSINISPQPSSSLPLQGTPYKPVKGPDWGTPVKNPTVVEIQPKPFDPKKWHGTPTNAEEERAYNDWMYWH